MGDTENSPLLKPPTVHPPVSPNCYEKSRYSSSWSSAIKLLLLSTIVLVCTATLVQLNMRGGGDHHHSLSNSPSADSPGKYYRNTFMLLSISLQSCLIYEIQKSLSSLDGFFRCVSDPDTLIPLSAVNDDYCDCEEDGSDEWGKAEKITCTKNGASFNFLF